MNTHSWCSAKVVIGFIGQDPGPEMKYAWSQDRPDPGQAYMVFVSTCGNDGVASPFPPLILVNIFKETNKEDIGTATPPTGHVSTDICMLEQGVSGYSTLVFDSIVPIEHQLRLNSTLRMGEFTDAAISVSSGGRENLVFILRVEVYAERKVPFY